MLGSQDGGGDLATSGGMKERDRVEGNKEIEREREGEIDCNTSILKYMT